MKRAVIYIRMDLVSEEALTLQHRVCEEYCQRCHLTVAGTLVDIAPGNTLVNRSGLKDLRAMMAGYHMDVVVTYTLDRLAREMVDLGTLAREAEARGVHIVSVIGAEQGELLPLTAVAVTRERERLAWMLAHASPPPGERLEAIG